MGGIIALRTDNPRLRYGYKEVVELLPHEYKEAVTANEEKYRAKGHALLLWCITQSTHFLDPTIASVLQFIIARTYGYAKRGELISISQFSTGIFDSKSGRSIISPAVKHKGTVYKALKIIEKLGYIERNRVTINSADVVSLVVVKADHILEHTMTKEDARMLRESRKQKQANSLENDEPESDFLLDSPSLRVVQKRTTRVVQKPPTEYINIKDIKKISSSQAQNVKRVTRQPRTKLAIDCNTSAADAIAMAVARVTERRSIKARRTRAGGVPDQESLRAMWQSAIVEKYGFAIATGITGKQYGMFRRIAGAQHVEGSWADIITWAVKNWETINQEHREFLTYKKKQGDWSSADEKRVFLGSDRPDLYCFIMAVPKILKRYVDYKLKGKAVTVATSDEVEELKKELHATRLKVTRAQANLSRVLSGRGTDEEDRRHDERRRAAKVVIVDPITDNLDDSLDDEDLPEWK